jgi:hypothetical protein
MMASPPTNLERRPFPNGIGDIYDDQWWSVLPAAFRSAPWAWRARKALAEAFDNDFLIEQTFVSHPIGYQSIFRYGRWALFRLGLALSALNAFKATQSRLIARDLYEACATELDLGLFLGMSCLEIVHEPKASTSGARLFCDATSNQTCLGGQASRAERTLSNTGAVVVPNLHERQQVRQFSHHSARVVARARCRRSAPSGGHRGHR